MKEILDHYIAGLAGLADLDSVVRSTALMTIALEDIYVQRALATDAASGLINYVQTYYTYVLTPAVLAIGMMKMKPLFIASGLAGFFLTYLIDAQKLSAIVPVVMFAIWMAYRHRRTLLALFTGGLAALTAICAGLTSHTPLTELVINVLIFRAIAVLASRE